MCVCMCMIYLGRQVGCCEELIMVQQSGARLCFILVMGFHSLPANGTYASEQGWIPTPTATHRKFSHVHKPYRKRVYLKPNSAAHKNRPHAYKAVCLCLAVTINGRCKGDPCQYTHTSMHITILAAPAEAACTVCFQPISLPAAPLSLPVTRCTDKIQ